MGSLRTTHSSPDDSMSSKQRPRFKVSQGVSKLWIRAAACAHSDPYCGDAADASDCDDAADCGEANCGDANCDADCDEADRDDDDDDDADGEDATDCDDADCDADGLRPVA